MHLPAATITCTAGPTPAHGRMHAHALPMHIAPVHNMGKLRCNMGATQHSWQLLSSPDVTADTSCAKGRTAGRPSAQHCTSRSHQCTSSKGTSLQSTLCRKQQYTYAATKRPGCTSTRMPCWLLSRSAAAAQQTVELTQHHQPHHLVWPPTCSHVLTTADHTYMFGGTYHPHMWQAPMMPQ